MKLATRTIVPISEIGTQEMDRDLSETAIRAVTQGQRTLKTGEA
jgi:hypothetical protein